MNILGRLLVNTNRHISHFQASSWIKRENILLKTGTVAVGVGLVSAFVSTKVSPVIGVAGGVATFAYLTKDAPDLEVKAKVQKVKEKQELKDQIKSLSAQNEQLQQHNQKLTDSLRDAEGALKKQEEQACKPPQVTVKVLQDGIKGEMTVTRKSFEDELSRLSGETLRKLELEVQQAKNSLEKEKVDRLKSNANFTHLMTKYGSLLNQLEDMQSTLIRKQELLRNQKEDFIKQDATQKAIVRDAENQVLACREKIVELEANLYDIKIQGLEVLQIVKNKEGEIKDLTAQNQYLNEKVEQLTVQNQYLNGKWYQATRELQSLRTQHAYYHAPNVACPASSMISKSKSVIGHEHFAVDVLLD